MGGGSYDWDKCVPGDLLGRALELYKKETKVGKVCFPHLLPLSEIIQSGYFLEPSRHSMGLLFGGLDPC